MRRLIAIILLLSIPSFASNWFANACNSTNISTCDWRPTPGASCVGTGTALVWASRAAGDNFYSNGCTAIVLDVDPGVGGSPVNLLNTNGNSANAGGYFTLTASITATVSVTAGGTLPTGNGALQPSGTPTATIGCSTCVFQGGSVANSQAVADTHTASTITVIGYAKGGTNSTHTEGYNYNAASGSVDGSQLNSTGGSGTPGFLLGNSGATAMVHNCIGTDGNGAVAGCNTSAQSTAQGYLTVKGSLVNGKNVMAAIGKIAFNPASAASAVYIPANSSYASTDIVDSNGNVLGSPTLTNAYVFPVAYATTGIGNAAKVLAGVTYGPYTGTATSGAGNSGSAH